MPKALVLVTVLWLSVFLVTRRDAWAQTPPPSGGGSEQTPATWAPTPARTVRLFPAGDIYPVYVADRHRTTNAVSVGFYPGVDVPESSSPRTHLAAGGHFGILRIDPKDRPGRSWQISLDAGFDALFDAYYKNDGIGWDGNYGLTVTTASNRSAFGLKVAILHISAHLGDEYAERTGTRRVNYTREELAVGVAWSRSPRWRTYGEAGFAYLIRTDAQERWRWQGGVEYEAPPGVLGGRMAWYGAVDLSAMQERGWRPEIAVQGGLLTRSSGRAYRIFAEWSHGRVPLGHFYQYSETCLSLGFKLDL